MIRRLLVANRGEIARRVFRTARAMGMETVAVYADGDAGEPFVAEADVAIALGGRTAAETYLDVAKVLEAARRAGADAVHPGYGFLSENAGFAAAVTEAGLTWVGPPPGVIEAMGDKVRAKAVMKAAGVPVLESIEPAAATEFPVLVKAAAGGGGKGMRIVERSEDLPEAVAAAQREAQSAFGDPTVFVEPYMAGARHVEVQIFGDAHGNVVHCFERECSIQRRHQKIVEESPSPALDDGLRARITDAAVKAGQAVGYQNAGTVEFILGDDARFYFLEVNTRLQVEHPVTEEVTGLDLVREQLLVAMGEPLSFGTPAMRGHAIEVRLYAEDVEAGFLPATGTVDVWRPCEEPTVRFESGVEQGSVVGIEFDPMLAKVVAWAPTRREAAGRLALALQRTRIAGVVTNRDYLVGVLRSDAFLRGDTTTAFVEQVAVPARREPAEAEVAAAAIAATLRGANDRRAAVRVLTSFPSGWRNSVMPPQRVTYRVGDDEVLVEYAGPPLPGRGSTFTVGGDEHHVEVHGEALVIDGVRATYNVVQVGRRWLVHGPGTDIELEELPRFPEPEIEVVAGGLLAPMPGKVISVHVSVGDAVERGQVVAVIEAMKMEHRLVAHHPGVVTAVRAEPGHQVGRGELLVIVEESAG